MCCSECFGIGQGISTLCFQHLFPPSPPFPSTLNSINKHPIPNKIVQKTTQQQFVLSFVRKEGLVTAVALPPLPWTHPLQGPPAPSPKAPGSVCPGVGRLSSWPCLLRCRPGVGGQYPPLHQHRRPSGPSHLSLAITAPQRQKHICTKTLTPEPFNKMGP